MEPTAIAQSILSLPPIRQLGDTIGDALRGQTDVKLASGQTPQSIVQGLAIVKKATPFGYDKIEKKTIDEAVKGGASVGFLNDILNVGKSVLTDQGKKYVQQQIAGLPGNPVLNQPIGTVVPAPIVNNPTLAAGAFPTGTISGGGYSLSTGSQLPAWLLPVLVVVAAFLLFFSVFKRKR